MRSVHSPILRYQEEALQQTGRPAEGVTIEENPHLERGQRLRAMRLALGFPNASAFCRMIQSLGAPMTPARLNNFERGRNFPNLGDPVVKAFWQVGISLEFVVSGESSVLPAELRRDVLRHLRSIQEANAQALKEDR